MPNHVTSEMTLTFNSQKGFDQFAAAVNADENICQAVMPVTYSGGSTITTVQGDVLATKQDMTVTMPDGTTKFIPWDKDRQLPIAHDGFWGTKWGTYDVEMDTTLEKDVITLYFSTAWGPLSDTLLLAMTDKFDIDSLSYRCFDWGMCWAQSKELELGEISTFYIDDTMFANEKQWVLAVNKYWGYAAIDPYSYDDEEEEIEEREGLATDKFNEMFRKHDGVPT